MDTDLAPTRSTTDTDPVPSSAERPFRRIAAFAGITFFVLFVVVIVLQPDVGNPGDSAAVLRADFNRHLTSIQVFNWVVGLQAVLLLLFATGLRDRLSRAGQPLLAGLGMAGAVAVLAVTAVQHGCIAAMSYLVQTGHAADVQLTALNALSYGTETVVRFPMAVLVGALSLGILRSRTLPRWVGYLGVVEAAASLVAAGSTNSSGALQVNGPIAVPSLLLLLVWTLAGSIALLRSADRPAR
ncbi:MAG: hypothetical protein NVS3B26_11110 [Mycobacteriales bacterium]